MGNICTAALYKIRKVIYIHKIFTNRFAIMKKLFTWITLFILVQNATAQKNVLRQVADSIKAEGGNALSF